MTHIFFWISLILFASIGLRGASRVLEITMRIFNLNISTPSWYTGRLWLMRLGYYKLNRPKVITNDWIWIIDHSVQIGSEKCFVILGIRLCDLPINRSLRYEDVEPIELVPVTKSNGNIVYEQLESASKKTGIPREIVADKGPDIKYGIEKFCEKHQETSYIYDVTHMMASMLKSILENDVDWDRFAKLCVQTKQQVQQTSLAALAPPNQRSKSRYMNVDILIKWAENMIMFLHQTDSRIGKNFDIEKVKEKFSWIDEYFFKILTWSQMMRAVSTTEDFVRKNGLYNGVEVDLKNKLNELNFNVSQKSIIEDIVNAIKSESRNAKHNERLLGSSEIIESLFGKQKYIEKQQSKSGFTGLILSSAALVSNTTKSVVKKAMELTKTQHVINWCKENLKKSVQAKRAEAFDFSTLSIQSIISDTFSEKFSKTVEIVDNNNIGNAIAKTIPMVNFSNKSEQKVSQDLLVSIG